MIFGIRNIFKKKKMEYSRIYEDVKFLTEIRPYRNYRNIDTLNKVADYIKNEFEKIGLDVEEQPFIADNNTYKNIIGSYNSTASKRLIVGAHYDVDGDQEGADDNASAVAGLLELARLVAENKPNLDYRIDFVAFNLEEMPFYTTNEMGSYVHAKSLNDNDVDVIGMICLEMIGYFSDEPNSQTYPLPHLYELYPSVGDFILVVGKSEQLYFNSMIFKLMKKDSKIDVQKLNVYMDDPLAQLAVLSDHRNYWKFGYDAVMINDTSFIRNPNYHKKSDTIDTLDFDKISKVVDCLYNAVIGMK